MRISKKSYYGLRAVVAIAAEGEMSAHDVAVAEDLPEDYLEKILQILSRAGIVRSEKGVSGGYTLPHPECVTALDVFTALEGKIRAFPAPALTKSDPYPKLTHCRTNLVWKTLEHEIEETLSQITIARLLSGKSKVPMSKAKSNPNFK